MGDELRSAELSRSIMLRRVRVLPVQFSEHTQVPEWMMAHWSRALAEPQIIFGTPTTGWTPKEKQGGRPLVSLPLRQCETLSAGRSELERPSFGVETFHALSVASSPILGVCAPRRLPLPRKTDTTQTCPDLAERARARYDTRWTSARSSRSAGRRHGTVRTSGARSARSRCSNS